MQFFQPIIAKRRVRTAPAARQNLPLQNPTGFDERPKACYTDYNDTERVRNVRRIIACLLICAAVLLCFAGCGSDDNSKIVGKWQATKVKLKGETINFSELESEGKEFSFDFIMYGNKEEKLKYDRGVLTLTFYYNNEATSYMFTKIE